MPHVLLYCIKLKQKLLQTTWDAAEINRRKDRRPASGTGRHQKVQRYKKLEDPSEDPALFVHMSSHWKGQAKQVGVKPMPATCNSF